ncbi:hypothetical protein ACFPTY_03495 [Halomonas beimenensis]|uniref:hypothetical protein n=1 Tax=Halomonas beimenensis TaxID=475662 RepID=UPI0012905D33|nr:hypothetical protein [Halomonas beimenensis]
MNERQKRIKMRRKPVAIGDGQNSKKVAELASELIRRGYTRQAAYAKARRKYREQYRKGPKRMLQGGGATPK